MARSDVNNAARQDLALLRRWYNDMEWQVVRTQGPDSPGDVGTFSRVSSTQFTITLAGTDLTEFFPAGRLLKIPDGSGAGVDLITQVVSSSYLSDVTTVNTSITSARAIDVAASDVLVYFSASARSQLFEEGSTVFFIPDTADSAGIQAAIDAAHAAGGGIVLLQAPAYTIDATITIDNAQQNVLILGDQHETTVIQEDGALLDDLFLIDHATARVEFKNILFDGNRANNATGNCRIIRINAAARPIIHHCFFADCGSAIYLSGASIDGVRIDSCQFFTFETFGIATNAATDTSNGTIRSCALNGGGFVSADPAGIKVAGQWAISDCRLTSMGSAGLLPRGIWLWNETGTNNGGVDSSVVGCAVFANGAANGIGIELGGRRNRCVGNMCAMGSAGVGIYVHSLAAGQFIDGNTVHGNSVNGGLIGIQLNSLTGRNAVVGNSIIDATTGIEVDSQLGAIVSANHIRGGTTGINVGGNSDDVVVLTNVIDGTGTSGILVDVGATNADLRNNRMPNNAGTDVVYNSGSVKSWQNGDFENGALFQSDTNVPGFSHTYWNLGPQDIFPGTYLVLYADDTSGVTAIPDKLHVGPNGDETDPVVIDFFGLSEWLTPPLAFTVSPSASPLKLGMAHENTGAGPDVNHTFDLLILKLSG